MSEAKGADTEVIMVAGGFAPLRQTHVAMLLAAKARGARVIVGLNSDAWLVQQNNGMPAFMALSERKAIVAALRSVDEVVTLDDSDGNACSLIRDIVGRYGNTDAAIYFGTSGKRTLEATGEAVLCEGELQGRVKILWGLGDHDVEESGDVVQAWVAAAHARRDACGGW